MKWKKFLLVGILVVAMVLFAVPAVLNAIPPVEDLQLTAICLEAQGQRCWKVTNPNDFSVPFSFKAYWEGFPIE